MISKFGANTALLLIDVQKGVNDLLHWGGPTGRRNNPDAEVQMQTLLSAWRARRLPVIFTQHDSRQTVSPLKISLPGGAFLPGLEPLAGELVVWKDVNSAFIGTVLELELRRRGITRLVVVGFFTNFCVETTVRMAGNMGYDTYLVPDGCSTSNRIGPDGVDHDPERVHDLAVASMHGEFCTALTPQQVLALLEGDLATAQRMQRNE
ncbi:Nicotinamidase-related amidase [Rhodoferax sp. OV413]|uniref:cysteine hydrolase family protein n=1 Tax=Rhodoferax sp. OV413 TaxID=1855285 RepID=UPI000890F33B|nr:cysteine hydrolase family protein [Rhodoferax sp. OV413]SDO94833.1 Nicotinamidase-related amidase [Rhodoferax sp. OV413]